MEPAAASAAPAQPAPHHAAASLASAVAAGAPPDAVVAACAALPTDASVAARSGAAAALAAALRAYPASPAVVRAASDALHALVVGGCLCCTRDAVVDAGVIGALADVLASSAEDADAAEAACRALSEAANRHWRSKCAAVDRGAVEHAVALLTRHGATHRGVAAAACMVLVNLTHDVRVGVDRAVAAGAVRAVLEAALAPHGVADAAVAGHAAGVLRNVTAGISSGGKDAEKAAAAAIVAGGGVDLLAAALAAHGLPAVPRPADSFYPIPASVIGALRNLAYWGCWEPVMRAEGVLPALAAAAGGPCTATSAVAVAALHNLAAHPDAVPAIVAAGGRDALVRAEPTTPGPLARTALAWLSGSGEGGGGAGDGAGAP